MVFDFRRESLMLLSLILLPCICYGVDYQWDVEYAEEYEYSEINDMCSLLGTGGTGDQVLLVGGAWDDYSRRDDADVVLIALDPVDGSEDFEIYMDVWQNGAIAYGATVNTDGNYLVTGSCNIGDQNGTDFSVPFILEISTTGSVVNSCYPDPEPRWNPQVGFDIIEHSNGYYYMLGGANTGSQNHVFVAKYNENLVLQDYWISDLHGSLDESWSYAGNICEIPSGYTTEGGWIVAAYNQNTYGSAGPCLVALEEDLDEITSRSFEFHCWEPSSGSS